MVLGAGLCPGLFVLFRLTPFERPSAGVELLVLLAVVIPTFGTVWFLEARLNRRVKAADGHICPGCGYDLHTLPGESGICPECGRGFEKAELRRLWKDCSLFTLDPF